MINGAQQKTMTLAAVAKEYTPALAQKLQGRWNPGETPVPLQVPCFGMLQRIQG